MPTKAPTATPFDLPAFLDFEGAEPLLIGGREAADDLGIDLEPQPETEEDNVTCPRSFTCPKA